MIPSCRASFVDFPIFNKELAPCWRNNWIFRESLFTVTKNMKKSFNWFIRQTKRAYLCGSDPNCVRLSAKNQAKLQPGRVPSLGSLTRNSFDWFPLRAVTVMVMSVSGKVRSIRNGRRYSDVRLSPAVELGTIERNLTALGFALRTIGLSSAIADFPHSNSELIRCIFLINGLAKHSTEQYSWVNSPFSLIWQNVLCGRHLHEAQKTHFHWGAIVPWIQTSNLQSLQCGWTLFSVVN
jgi:hypothetical protein